MGKQQQQQGHGHGRGCSRYGSERLLYGPLVHYQVSSNGAGDQQLADLDEEDVWSVLDYSTSCHNRGLLQQPELQEHRRGGRRASGGLSLAFEACAAGTPAAARHQQQHHVGGAGASSAAPLKVPAEQWLARRSSFPSSSSSEEEEEAAGEWVAPHEYLQARRGSSSVFQGVGRTLKGRDLSRVREAVWSNTGFLG